MSGLLLLAATALLNLSPERYDTETVGRRTVDWYRHTGDPAWGDPVTNFVDRFSVAKPVDGDAPGRPLLVVLHWRGAGWPGKGVDLQTRLVDEKDRVFSAPDDFYVLNLDDIRDYHVLLNRTHDQYWWGATPAYRGPTAADVPRLMAGETPCERRVLDSVEWTCRRYAIDRDRVYLCGNSMGGQAAYAIGLAHGEIFAAINANVPATAWFAAARL
ncbi:MAG: prolyl oligopeptidase family serine peptidase, partial [Kiritimatiellae bacterium]|nr:prolyl oligopeptidase family serine peptidase [Kiritimatiellia bacterium]